MPFDGMFCSHLVQELQDRLAGRRVDKIHHPARDELVFTMGCRQGSCRLLFNLTPQRGRVQLTTQDIANPAQPSMFCMLLRKRLAGATLQSITQEGLDRVLYFHFSGANDIGEPALHTLTAEFLGRYANLILLQNGVVVEALKRVALRNERPVWPGLPYTPPQANGRTDGISPAVARELALHSNPPVGPWLVRGENGPLQFSFLPLTHLGPCEPMESYSQLLEVFYAESDNFQRTHQKTAALRQLLAKRIARIRRKLAAQQQELALAQNREQLRIHAELILANKAQLERDPAARGSSSYRLENYYNGNQLVSIPVNPALGPAGNAQKLFKSYQKSKNAANLLGNLIAQAEQDLAYLESVEDLLERAKAQTEIDALRRELEQQGYCKPNVRKGVRQAPLPPLEYVTPEGFTVLAGRSNVQNDQLRLQSRKTDLWFHAHGYPGSHVILRTEGAPPDKESIALAAGVAAWHSKARGACTVDYTPVKSLQKPGGAPPGKVIYHTYQSIAVSAVGEEIQRYQKDGGDANGRH
jgi:predicted ribosome quality control (RQC) complex YloA/Tae2 family protein